MNNFMAQMLYTVSLIFQVIELQSLEMPSIRHLCEFLKPYIYTEVFATVLRINMIIELG